MACNAHNHPLDCSCGFGGDTGSGGWSSASGHFLDHCQSRGWLGDGNGSVASYTIPNVHCPVCGARVFFYRSPYDGRVFFDHLGPPWPKHPCTDNGYQPRRALPFAVHGDDEGAASPMRRGWKPFYYPRVKWGFDGARVQGFLDDDRIHVVVLDGTRVDQGPIFLRPTAGAPGLYEIAYLSSDKMATSSRIAFACDTGLAEVDRALLLRAACGDPEALAEIGRFIMYELGDCARSKPYLERAYAGGNHDVLFDLAVMALYSQS